MDISIQILPYDMLSTFTSEILLRNILNIVKKEGYTFISISLLMCKLLNVSMPLYAIDMTHVIIFLIMHCYDVIQILQITIEIIFIVKKKPI